LNGCGEREGKEKSEEGKERANSHNELVIGKKYRHGAEEGFVLGKDSFDGDVVEDELDG
jgi:hypothetical protein